MHALLLAVVFRPAGGVLDKGMSPETQLRLHDAQADGIDGNVPMQLTGDDAPASEVPEGHVYTEEEWERLQRAHLQLQSLVVSKLVSMDVKVALFPEPLADKMVRAFNTPHSNVAAL
jgi:hypothetical protein